MLPSCVNHNACYLCKRYDQMSTTIKTHSYLRQRYSSRTRTSSRTCSRSRAHFFPAAVPEVTDCLCVSRTQESVATRNRDWSTERKPSRDKTRRFNGDSGSFLLWQGMFKFYASVNDFLRALESDDMRIGSNKISISHREAREQYPEHE